MAEPPRLPRCPECGSQMVSIGWGEWYCTNEDCGMLYDENADPEGM